MAAPPNVEMEAAKFLHKLIQESKDEPTKLATKLHVILQHMRSSGKENSMPYQVISRAMETVINQHNLDIDALTSSRIPLTTGTQVADSASSQFAGSSLRGAVAMEANTSLVSGDLKNDSYASNRPPVGPSFTGHDIYQGSVSHLNSKSLDHESPSSFDTRSAKSHSEERHDSPKWEKSKKKDNKKGGNKRKKADPPSNSESQFGNVQPLESSTFSSGMDKAATKMDQPRNISIQASEHGQLSNMVQSSSMMEHNTMRSALRAKQEIQHQAEKSLDSTNISNSLSRTPHSRHPEEIEVSSAHNVLSRQGVSLPVAHDALNTRGAWNQTKSGTPFEKSQVPRFSFNTSGGNLSGETLLHQSAGAAGTGYGMAIGTSGAYATTVPGLPGSVQFSNTYDTSSLGPKMNKDRNMEPFPSVSSLDPPSDKGAFGKALEYEGGSIHTSGNDSSLVQGGMLNNMTEMAMLRNTGKLPVSQSPSAPIMPFKEQHLKQLRAQCLVYLAFRNGLKPKKLHLDFALGNFLPKEEGPSKDMIEHKGKEQLFDGTSNTSDVHTPYGRLENLRESDNLRLDPSSVGMLADVKLAKGESMNMPGEKNGMSSGLAEYGEESRQIMMARRKADSEMQTGEIVQSQLSAKGVHPDGFSSRSSPRNNHKDDLDNRHQQVRSIDQASSVMGMGQQLQTEVTGQSGNSCDEEASNLSLQSLAAFNESVPERKDNAPSQSYTLADRNFQGSRPADAYLPSFPASAHWKPLSRTDGGNLMVSPDDSKISHKNYSGSVGSIRVPSDNALLNGNPFLLGDTVHEEEDVSVATDFPSSPKYTTTEKWIIDQQKRKLLTEKTWALKQQRTQQKITACSDKLKDNVSSSEDISAKTRSVIELKKLQLLELQRRLRKDILDDFFRPIASDMDRLKSIKKHRIGRRSKQLEKYEQKMKEERQKRFRERQKEFFSEIEIHKERLEDVFKMRRERWKGFNRSVREFHKRKERIHREKIDRIQREKINLLKINDVEGYLRMVQDAKSDRVKQLLKETEKYLQKLGSKLRDAKALNRCFETDMDAGVMEKNDMITDNEDETDQAKHYLESNEKYYLMAHSIKETVAEQPSSLVGGKLREYQMNGLRWLVSLYNNHLNGILADEMGLGKTVQVISLICYLMENKNDRGPFLVVVPSSVLPGWDSEINFWAPSINKIVYSGPPEERRRLFKERIIPQKFNVLLTTYEYLMNKHDRPKLSKIHWHYVIIDEGHRIKNASCKLNADLKLYHSSHRLLLTGTPLQNNLEELWALLNFLLPNIFNSSEDFSQWFNKPFESNGDSSPDEALLSEEENLLIINRLHQVLRPFVLRRLKHKVENELPEKIERLVRCEASAYQKLLMKRVEDNLGALGTSKARSVHNSVMELRNICNHPYLSQLHSEEVHEYIPKHYLPNIVRLCGKLEMLDRILPKLKATDHRVLLFSTMTRLLDVMEDYLYWKQYKYLRLDGHTSGGDRGALIDQYNKPDSPYFIFLLSIRAGGVGVNLQAADTVIIFDTDWNPQVDLQAQARAHRIGQKREVLVLRFETVQTVEEQVRAAAEHKLGVANQSITAGFFDNNTSAEDRREYLESLLRESKKEEAAPVLHDDAVNDLIARSESEIDIFESIDKRRQEEEMAAWKLALGGRANSSELVQTLPSRLVTAEELKAFSEAMKIYDAPSAVTVSNIGGIKRKSGYLGGLDTQHYGRGKRAREVRSYEEQWTEDEFEKLCQAESPHSPKMKDEVKEMNLPMVTSENSDVEVKAEAMLPPEQPTQPPLVQSAKPTLAQSMQPLIVQSVQPPLNTTEPPLVHSTQSLVAQSGPLQQAAQSPVQTAYPSVSKAGHTPIMQPTQRSKDTAPKRGRGRPKRATQIFPSLVAVPSLSGTSNMSIGSQTGTVSNPVVEAGLDHVPSSVVGNSFGTIQLSGGKDTSQALSTLPSVPSSQPTLVPCPIPVPDKRRGRKGQSGVETPRRRGRKPIVGASTTPVLSPSHGTDNLSMVSKGENVSDLPAASVPAGPPVKGVGEQTSSVSMVPVLLPSENIKPQDVQVSGSCILSNPSVPAGTSVGTSNPEQNVPFSPLPPEAQAVSVGTDTTSQQNPQLSSVTSSPRSISSSLVVAKQVKGRGNKTQSENETPRRRGRKQNAATAVPGGSGGQELTSNEPPQKKSRVSSGKTAVASRRKQQIETQSSVNVIQAEASDVHTSDNVVGPALSDIADRPYQSEENTQATSSTVALEVAVRSPSKEFANVKVSQLDMPVSGDGTLLAKMEAVKPVGTELCKSPIKNYVPPIEVTGDNQSSEFQSPGSDSLPLTQSTSQALGIAPLSGTGIFDVKTKEKSGGKVEEITNASLGATQTDIFTDISEIQNLECRKFSARSNMETSSATEISGDTSNLASSTMETDQALNAVSVGSPFEKKCGEKLEEVPRVNKSESPKIEVSVQDVADTDKFTEESVAGKDEIQHVSKKSVNTKDSMAHVTREALSYVECNVVEAEDAVVETGESIQSYEVGGSLDETGHVPVGSCEANRNSEIIADATNVADAKNVAAADADCSAGLVAEKFIPVNDDRMSDPCSLTGGSGEEPERTVEAVVAPEDNTEIHAGKEKSEAEVQYEAKDLLGTAQNERKEDTAEMENKDMDLQTNPIVSSGVNVAELGIEMTGEPHQSPEEEGALTGCIEEGKNGGENVAELGTENVGEPHRSPEEEVPYQAVKNVQATSSTVALEVAVRSTSEEFANVKVSQLDMPVSGDGTLLTKMEASQSGVELVGAELCQSPLKNVDPPIEVTGDTQSLEDQSPRSESLPLTQSTFQDLGIAPLSAIGIFDVQTKEESGGKVERITNASSGATQTDTFTDISEIQNLESGKFSALHMGTRSAAASSGDACNLASSTLETDQAPDALSLGSPFEKKCGEKLEDDPQVNKSESPKIDVSIHDVADTDKFTEEYVGGKDAIQHVFEKSVDKKDCVVVEADDSMVETGESLHSYEVGPALDGTGHDPRSGANRNSEIIADAVSVEAAEAECSPGLLAEKFIPVKDVRMGGPWSSTGCSGEGPEGTVDAVVVPECNTENYSAMEKSAGVHYEAKDSHGTIEHERQEDTAEMESKDVDLQTYPIVDSSGENVAELVTENIGEPHQSPEEEGAFTGCSEDNKEGGEIVAEFGTENIGEPHQSPEEEGPYQSVENIQATSSTLALEVAISSPSKEFANVNVSQLDMPVSGDGTLLTKVEASQIGVEPVGTELCESPKKNVIEVTGDTQSLEYQSPRSEGIPLTQSTFQALRTAPLSGIGIFDVQTNEESSGKVEEITNASLKATQTDTFTDISEIQNLESRKFPAQSNMETSSAPEISGDTSNLASSTLETDQALNAVSVGSPFEKKCDEKLEVVPQVNMSESKLEEVPQVNMSESPKIDVFVQDIADSDKLTVESVEGKDAIQHVSEKSVNTKDSMAHVTREAVSYVECNVVEADDAMVETRESIHSYEVGASLDESGHVPPIGSSGANENSEIIADVISVAAVDADCSGGLEAEKFISVKDVRISDQLERTVEAVVAPEYNTEIYAAKEKSGAEVQYEAKDLLGTVENERKEDTAEMDNKDVDLQTNPIVDSSGEIVAELGAKNNGEPHQSPQEEGVLTVCRQDNKKGGENVTELTEDTKDELMHEMGSKVQSSTGGGEGHDDLHTEHVAE